MVNKIHYRWDFIGLSTDTKPTPEDSPKVVNGSTFYESDTSKLFVFYKDTWYERKPLGGDIGKARVLTTADYNWPTAGTPNSVALWLLEPGLYVPANTSVTLRSSLSGSFSTGFAIVGKPPINGNVPILVVLPSSIRLVQTRLSDGQQILAYGIPIGVIDNLTSTSTAFALSANQGRVLKGLIDALDARVAALEGN